MASLWLRKSMTPIFMHPPRGRQPSVACSQVQTDKNRLSGNVCAPYCSHPSRAQSFGINRDCVALQRLNIHLENSLGLWLRYQGPSNSSSLKWGAYLQWVWIEWSLTLRRKFQQLVSLMKGQRYFLCWYHVVWGRFKLSEPLLFEAGFWPLCFHAQLRIFAAENPSPVIGEADRPA